MSQAEKVWAATDWPDNGALIADFCHLYVRRHDVVLDMTYGKGNFWTVTRPEGLVAHDLFTLDGVDYTNLPERSGSVDVAVFDPTYVAPGGRETSTIDGMNEAYGMDRTPLTPQQQLQEIEVGLAEAHRVLRSKRRGRKGRKGRPGGLLALKCMTYVSSGKLQDYTRWAKNTLDDIGFDMVDEFVMVGRPGPQPTHNLDGSVRQQKHARNNHSFLLVARKR